MRNLCKLFLALALAGFCAEAAVAQYTTVTAASGAISMGGTPIAAGTAIFYSVDASGHPQPYTLSGGGLNVPDANGTAAACTITAGTLGTCHVPNAATSLPAGLIYNIAIADTSSGNPTSGQAYIIKQVHNISGSTWQLDHYAPMTTVSTLPAFSYTQGVGAPSGAGGTNALYADITTPSAPVLYTWTGSAWGLAGGSVSVTYGTTAGTAAQGNDSRILASLKTQGVYTSGTTYAINDVVTASGSYYVSLVSGNLGNPPATSPTQWGAISATAGGFTGNSNGVNLQNVTGTKYFCTFGDSRSAGTGASPSTNGWNFLFAADKGWSQIQKATSGYDMSDIFQTITASTFSQTNSSSTCTTNLFWIGVNGNMLSYHGAAEYLADLVWISAPDTQSSGNPVKITGAGATKTGTGWTTTDHYATGAKTTVSGDTATGTVLAANAIYPIVSYALGNNFTWCFTIDSQPQVCHGPMAGNGSINNGMPYEFYQVSHGLGLTYIPYAVREPVFSYVTNDTTGGPATKPLVPRIAQPHTWTFTCQNANGSACYLEGVVGDGVGNAVSGLQTWVLGDFRGSSAANGLITSAVENRIVSGLAADGFNIGFIPLSDAIDCITTTSQCADGLHPSNSGHLLIEQRVLGEMTSLVTPRDRQGMKSANLGNPQTLVWSYLAWNGNTTIGNIANITPDAGTLLKYVLIHGPNLTCTTYPTFTLTQGSAPAYTLTYATANTATSSGPIAFQIFPGALGPVVVNMNAGVGCTGSAATLSITAGFSQF